MAAYYDAAIIAAIAASDRPLRHRDIAELLAPGDWPAWNQIGTALTRLYRAGAIDREKLDGHYWHYTRKETAMRTISYDDYLRLVGLLTLAADHRRVLRGIERAACGITGDADDAGSHTGDTVWGGSRDTADGLLAVLGITVEERA